MEEKPVIHGVLYSYVGKGCRCKDCTEAMRRYSANYRQTPEGREKAQRSSRRSNFLRAQAVKWVKTQHPDVFASFEASWEGESVR